jgi:hypothetical protein
MLASLALPMLLAQAADPAAEAEATLRARAALCGSEVQWAADWNVAATRARAERKLILLAFQKYPGFEIGDLPALGPFIDEDVIALVNARYVPLRLRHGMDSPLADPVIYGMGPATFGVALILAKPDGEVMRGTFSLHTSVALEFLRAGLRGSAGLASPPLRPGPRLAGSASVCRPKPPGICASASGRRPPGSSIAPRATTARTRWRWPSCAPTCSACSATCAARSRRWWRRRPAQPPPQPSNSKPGCIPASASTPPPAPVWSAFLPRRARASSTPSPSWPWARPPKAAPPCARSRSRTRPRAGPGGRLAW